MFYTSHKQHSNSPIARNTIPYFGLDFRPEIGKITREIGACEKAIVTRCDFNITLSVAK